jgi:hypothetical protein
MKTSIRIGAQKALKAHLIWFLGSEDLLKIMPPHQHDGSTKALVYTCQELRTAPFKCGDLCQKLLENKILEDLTRRKVLELQGGALVMLSLLFRHFCEVDGYLFRLVRFFETPFKRFDRVCEDIHPLYNIFCMWMSLADFKKRFNRLLDLVECWVIKGSAIMYL